MGIPQWSEADETLARAAQAEMKSTVEGLRKAVAELKPAGVDYSNAGSDDIAEVSWNLPTVVLRYPGNIPGITGRAGSPWPHPLLTKALPRAPRHTP